MPYGDRRGTAIRLLVDIGESSSTSKRRLREGIRSALADDGGDGGWVVTRLFAPDPTSIEAQAARYWVVAGTVDEIPGYPIQAAAFDLAARLARETGFVVEPDLPSAVYAPGPAPFRDPSAPEFRSGASDEVPLPETASRRWALQAVGLPQAWALEAAPGGARCGAGVSIGQPDTGYTEHPEIEDALDLTRDRDILGGDDDARDPLSAGPLRNPGHGTRTASVVVSRATREVTGVAPRARIVPIRAITSVVNVFDGDVARAVDYARRSGCHVISMSLGGVGFSGLQAAIRFAIAEGLIVTAAAGNEVGFVTAPANYPECIAVAAVDARDDPWRGSSRGPAVDIAAPGHDVWVARTRRIDGVETYDAIRSSGTSYAVAHVAGIAALWLSHHGRDALIEKYGAGRIQQVFARQLRTTARTPPGWDVGNFGAGIADAARLLAEPLPAVDAVTRMAAAPLMGGAERVRAVVPRLSKAEMLAGLGDAVGTGQPLSEDILSTHSAEVVRLLVDIPGLRARVQSPHKRRPETRARYMLTPDDRMSIALSEALATAPGGPEIARESPGDPR